MKKLLAVTAFSAFVVSGPVQHAGLLPVTALGTASMAAIEIVLDLTVAEAVACPGNGKGNGNGNGNGRGGGRGRR
jgi:hypothetical protein